MKHYFVTGATGVVGSSLVPVLLRDPDVRVTLLIRARDPEELARRLDTLHAFWETPAHDTALRARVRAVAGDTTLDRFGLDPVAYDRLRTACTHIIHAAGLVRMNLSLDDARASALGSARQVVALARACDGLQKLDMVSTVGVGGRMTQTVPERWLREPRGYHNTYEQAKAEAEDYLRTEIERAALPLTVHRPSMVVGHSRDGRIIGFQVFYFLCEFLSGQRTFGLYPDFGDARLDIIACDIVAEAIAASSVDPRSSGLILNLCSGPTGALRIDDLKRTVRETYAHAGLKVPADRTLTQARFAGLARFASRFAPGPTRKALATLPIYLAYLADSQGFEDTVFSRWWAERLPPRPAAADYLPQVLAYYLARRRAR